MNFAALGRTELLYRAIQVAIERGHRLCLVGTAPAVPEYKVNEEQFRELAQQHGIPFFCDSRINHASYVRLAKESGAETAISVNWPTMIGAEMLGAFAHGIVNAHAGDLPRFRGNACPNWAILVGESQVGLTLHKMTPGLDDGPILAQRAFPLTDETYITEVWSWLSETAPILFADVLDGLEGNTIFPRVQTEDPVASLRCFPRVPEDSQLNWSESATYLSRIVRSSAEPYAGAYTLMHWEKIIVWRAHPERLAYPTLGVAGQVVGRRADSGEVLVLTGDGVLVLEEIELASGWRGRPADVIKSNRSRLGINQQVHLLELKKELDEITRRLTRIEKRIELASSEE